MQPEHDFFEVSVNGGQPLSLDGDTLDFTPIGPDSFHILMGAKRFQATLLDADDTAKRFRIRVNGSVYEVKIADRYDQLVEKLGLSRHVSTKVKDIKAPMPGMVLEIHAVEGERVEKGQALLILEAMKMENAIKSPGEGIVKRICVQKGQAVDKNQLLLEMD
jgi:biotin carboxyl carrier protein